MLSHLAQPLASPSGGYAAAAARWQLHFVYSMLTLVGEFLGLTLMQMVNDLPTWVTL
jgi:hypothetical protein